MQGNLTGHRSTFKLQGVSFVFICACCFSFCLDIHFNRSTAEHMFAPYAPNKDLQAESNSAGALSPEPDCDDGQLLDMDDKFIICHSSCFAESCLASSELDDYLSKPAIQCTDVKKIDKGIKKENRQQGLPADAFEYWGVSFFISFSF